MTHAAIISLWPTIAQFATDIGAKYVTAKAMHRRSVIPAGYWTLVVRAAAARGFKGVTLEALAEAVALENREAAE